MFITRVSLFSFLFFTTKASVYPVSHFPLVELSRTVAVPGDNTTYRLV